MKVYQEKDNMEEEKSLENIKKINLFKIRI